jgi:hypothetical protein
MQQAGSSESQGGPGTRGGGGTVSYSVITEVWRFECC